MVAGRYDVQKAGRPRTSHVGNVIDEAPRDAVLPEVRLDEQGVQLRSRKTLAHQHVVWR